MQKYIPKLLFKSNILSPTLLFVGRNWQFFTLLCWLKHKRRGKHKNRQIVSVPKKQVDYLANVFISQTLVQCSALNYVKRLN